MRVFEQIVVACIV